MHNQQTISKVCGTIIVLFVAIGTVALSAAADDAPALTIYNQNFFVAREHLPMDLKAGVNHVDFAGIAAHLEPDSVILRDPNGRTLQILEQNYRNDPISQELLLSFSPSTKARPSTFWCRAVTIKRPFTARSFVADTFPAPATTTAIRSQGSVNR